MEREAGRAAVVDERWEDDFDLDDEDGQMTPIDEDEEDLREVEGLVEGWLGSGGGGQASQRGILGNEIETETDDMDAQFDFEDSDVEEVFMQVLSQQAQQGNGQLPSQSHLEQQQQAQQTQEQQQPTPSGGGNGDEHEDLEMLAVSQSQRDTDML